jgi:hypothetical protein
MNNYFGFSGGCAMMLHAKAELFDFEFSRADIQIER